MFPAGLLQIAFGITIVNPHLNMINFKDEVSIAVHKTPRIKHIVRFDKILLYNSVNFELGYMPIQSYSPREVTKIEKD